MAKRMLAVFLLFIGGVSATVLTAQPAEADCIAVEVYTYQQGDPGTRHYVSGLGPYQCVPFSDQGFPTVNRTRVEHEQNAGILPPGTTNGAGVAVWVVAP